MLPLHLELLDQRAALPKMPPDNTLVPRNDTNVRPEMPVLLWATDVGATTPCALFV